MITIAIVSNSETAIQRLRTITKEIFGQHAIIKNFQYASLAELTEICQNNRHTISGWIFSGTTPYSCAKTVLGNEKNNLVCPLTNMETIRYLLISICQSPDHELRVSMDVPETVRQSYEELFQETGLSEKEIKLFSYDPCHIDDCYKELADTHEKLWRSGKVNTILTSSTKVHQRLCTNGIPVTQVFSSNVSIREAVLRLKEQLMYISIKKRQVALLRFEPSDLDRLYTDSLDFFTLQKQDLKLKRHILRLCQEIHGCYFVAKDIMRYEIFASRGLIEENYDKIHAAVYELNINHRLNIRLGIGFADTAFDAQNHAFQALAYGRHQSQPSHVVVIDANGKIIVNPAGDKKLEISGASNNQELLSRLTKAGISIINYTKIQYIAAQRGQHGFTAHELSVQSGMTSRNASRLISKLLKASLLACIGEESLSGRGRPAKRYQLTQLTPVSPNGKA